MAPVSQTHTDSSGKKNDIQRKRCEKRKRERDLEYRTEQEKVSGRLESIFGEKKRGREDLPIPLHAAAAQGQVDS